MTGAQLPRGGKGEQEKFGFKHPGSDAFWRTDA
jgi:hypothetical protein